MTIKEAAASLGIAPSTLHAQIRLGVVKATKHGRDLWITEAEVNRYRSEHLRKGTA